MKNLVIIKLGGSLLTDKTRETIVQKQRIELLTSELQTLHAKMPDTSFLLGTGAGGYVHFTAHKYGLRDGAQTPDQLLGMSLAHNAALRLSIMVADELTSKDVPAFSISSSSMLACTNREPTGVFLEPIRNLLEAGVMPIVHGDTISDPARGTTIMSTEEVLQVCLTELRPNYQKVVVIYLLDTDGVYDKDGVLIPSLKADEEIIVHGNLEHDVTGGILGKVSSARKAALLADEVYIIGGKKPGTLETALTSGGVGTRVL